VYHKIVRDMKLKLILKNFRKFTDASWVFEEGLTLISGKSGQGKSTIFMAIIFVLTGEGKKLISFGKTSCSATLIVDDLVTITRTKHPNRLLLQKPGPTSEVLEDAEAQSVLNQIFYQYQTGYIAQRSTKSFLFLNPQDKMSFIERMVFGEESPETVHACCKTLLKERKDKLATVRASREAIEALLKEMNIQQTTNPKTHDQKNITESIPDVQKALEQYQLDLKQTSLYLDRVRENEKRRLVCTKRLNQLKEDVDNLWLSLAPTTFNLPTNVWSLTEIENELERLRAYNISLSAYRKAKKVLKGIDTTQHKIGSSEEIKICKRVCELAINSHTTQYRLNLTTLNNQISNTVTHLTCPACNTMLMLWGDNIKIAEDNKIQHASVKPLQVLSCAEVKKLEEQKTKTVLALETSITNQKELVILCTKYPDIFKHIDISESNLQSSIAPKILTAIKDAATKHIARLTESRRVLESYDKQKALCDSLRPKKTTRESIFTTEETESVLKRIRDALYEKKEVEKSLYSDYKNTESVSGLEQKVAMLEEAIKESKYILVSLKAAQHWNRVSVLAQEEDICHTKFSNATKLQDIVKISSKQSIVEVVEEINLTVQQYLDLFIEDVVVELTYNKGKLAVDVIQNGHQTDLNGLSGGEFARVLLAFTIALAEINNVRLLMIDETTASLDQDTATSVVDIIKEHFKGTVLVIAHQTTTGIFDAVVDLDTIDSHQQ